MHGIYKYEADGEVVYVGKTDSDFASRIACHRREVAFAPYREKAKVFVQETKDAREADFLETLLINQYKPVLNKKKKDVTNAQVSAILDWISWDEYYAKLRVKPQKIQKSSNTLYLSDDVLAELDRRAQKAKCSRSEYLDELLMKLFKL